MISFKTLLESRFSQDPFTISFIPPPPPYGNPPSLVSMERDSQAASGRDGYGAHGPLSMDIVGIYWNPASIVYYQYPHLLPKISPILTSTPFTLQVLQQSSIDSGSIRKGFEAENHVFLVGF